MRSKPIELAGSSAKKNPSGGFDFLRESGRKSSRREEGKTATKKASGISENMNLNPGLRMPLPYVQNVVEN